MAGATILVATVLSLLNIRTTNGVIDYGLRELADATTSSAAAASGAALRFGNAAAIGEGLGRVLETSGGKALRAVAVSAQGETLVDLGNASGVDMSELLSLARAAIASGEAQVSSDGFLRAEPSFAGSDTAAAVGAVAIAWTPGPSRAAAQWQLITDLALSATVLAILLFGAGRLLQRLVSRPVAVLAEEIVTLRSGRYDADIPFTARGDEIGTIARNLSDLQAQLAEAAEGSAARARIEEAQERVVQRLAIALQSRRRRRSHAKDRHTVRAPIRTLRKSFNETVETFVRVDRADGAQRRTRSGRAPRTSRKAPMICRRGPRTRPLRWKKPRRP
jgi:HAMP domain-containing protein